MGKYKIFKKFDAKISILLFNKTGENLKFRVGSNVISDAIILHDANEKQIRLGANFFKSHQTSMLISLKFPPNNGQQTCFNCFKFDDSLLSWRRFCLNYCVLGKHFKLSRNFWSISQTWRHRILAFKIWQKKDYSRLIIGRNFTYLFLKYIYAWKVR